VIRRRTGDGLVLFYSDIVNGHSLNKQKFLLLHDPCITRALPCVLSFCGYTTTDNKTAKSLKLRKGWRNPYVAMGLHIPHPLAQLVGFLWSSGSRLVWNGLQLAAINVVKQRSEDLPCSLRPTNTLLE